ncbi:MAG: ATP-binding protein [Chloroflexota bacterium]
MEHISDILKRSQIPINTSGENTDISSGASETQSTSVCPVCRGVGFVYADVRIGHPDFGRAIPCRCARDESAREREARLLRYSNLGALSHLTFEKLNPAGRSKNPAEQEAFHRVYEAAKEYARSPEGWFILTGPSGCGKTTIAAAIANACVKKGLPAFFISVADLLERMRAGFNPDGEIPYNEFFERVRSAPLLILDDLGAQADTPWSKEKIDQLINHRFVSALPTVIITIIPPDELDERIRTRLTNPDVCRIYRIGRKQDSLEYGWGQEFVLQKEMTFDSFDFKRVNLPAEQRENLKSVFDTVSRFAESPEGWLVLQGMNGCGKTHLASALANYRYRHRKPALFIVVPEFLDHLRATFSPERTVSYDELFESVKKTPLLILDDFGEQSTTPWAQEKLYQVINYRYNSRLPTVITTTKSLDEIEDRVRSRLIDHKLSMVWNITAPDYRGDRPTPPKTAGGGRKSRR